LVRRACPTLLLIADLLGIRRRQHEGVSAGIQAVRTKFRLRKNTVGYLQTEPSAINNKQPTVTTKATTNSDNNNINTSNSNINESDGDGDGDTLTVIRRDLPTIDPRDERAVVNIGGGGGCEGDGHATSSGRVRYQHYEIDQRPESAANTGAAPAESVDDSS
jgi:hypothetical protein